MIGSLALVDAMLGRVIAARGLEALCFDADGVRYALAMAIAVIVIPLQLEELEELERLKRLMREAAGE